MKTYKRKHIYSNGESWEFWFQYHPKFIGEFNSENTNVGEEDMVQFQLDFLDNLMPKGKNIYKALKKSHVAVGNFLNFLDAVPKKYWLKGEMQEYLSEDELGYNFEIPLSFFNDAIQVKSIYHTKL